MKFLNKVASALLAVLCLVCCLGDVNVVLADTPVTKVNINLKTDGVDTAGAELKLYNKTSEGYVGMDARQSDSSTITRAINNTSKTGKLQLSKTDSLNLSGNNPNYDLTTAVYGVYTVVQDTIGLTKIAEIPMTKGTLSEVVELPVGKYTIQEITEAKGYLSNPYAKDVTITDSDQVTVLELEANPILKRVRAQITTTNDLSLNNSNYSFIGTEFAIYHSPDRNSEPTLVTTLVVQGEDGFTDYVEVPLGIYHVKQLDSDGDGYVGTLYKHNGKISSCEVDQFTYSTTLIRSSDPYTNNFGIIKKSSDSSITNNNTYYDYEGNVYKVYTSYNSSTNTVSGEVASITIDENGYSKYLTKLLLGVYYVKEYSSNGTYELDKTVHRVDLSNTGYDKNNPYVLNLGAKPSKGTFKINKSSSNTDLVNGDSRYSLKGSKYGVYSDASCKKLVSTITTNENGSATISNLPLGKYYVKEIKASKGYKLNSQVHEVELLNSNILTLNVINEPVKYVDNYTLEVIKAGADNNLLKGVKFGLYSDADCKNLLGNYTTNDKGIITVPNLDGGIKYYLKEVSTLDGYKLDSTVHTIEGIMVNGDVAKVKFDSLEGNLDINYKVTFKLVADKKPVAIEPEVPKPEVTEPEATEPEATEPEDTESEVTKPEDTETEDTETEDTEIEVTETEDTETEVPNTTATKTSDNNNIIFPLVVSLLAGVSLLLGVLYKKKVIRFKIKG